MAYFCSRKTVFIYEIIMKYVVVEYEQKRELYTQQKYYFEDIVIFFN